MLKKAISFVLASLTGFFEHPHDLFSSHAGCPGRRPLTPLLLTIG
jgi:hypothetical protein